MKALIVLAIGVRRGWATARGKPVLANDVGIIDARSGPIAVSFLGNAITGNYGEAEDRIGRFA